MFSSSKNKLKQCAVRSASSLALALALSTPWILGSVACVAFFQSKSIFAQPQPITSARALPDFTDLVEAVGPSVVNIRTSVKVKSGRGLGGADNGDIDERMEELLRRFFGGRPMPSPRSVPRKGQPQPEEEERPRGVGSGFILSSDGLVMTNAHVVEGADDVLVTLADKREFKAKIIGADQRSDVAIVKIEASGLPAVHVGDVNRLKVGEWVLAFGSPFGLENTVTKGIVSAKQRDTGDYLPAIQTDVPINPGNSGGPLVNMRGEVVGINSQIYSRSGGSVGISFSIPMDEAIRVSDQLRTNGRVVRGRIGIQIGEVTKDIAEAAGMPKPAGAFVSKVESGDPADKAGVQPGDVIIRFDGKTIEKSSDLPRMVGNTKPGTQSTLTLLRRGAIKELRVGVAEFEADKPVKLSRAGRETEKPQATGKQILGLTVANLTEQEKKALKLRSGVKVELASGVAARAGIREGDVIVALANTEILNVQEFELVAGHADKSKPITVLLHRDGWAQYVLIRPTAERQ